MAQENMSGQGFAALDDERQREIAGKGGKPAICHGTDHRFTWEDEKNPYTEAPSAPYYFLLLTSAGNLIGRPFSNLIQLPSTLAHNA